MRKARNEVARIKRDYDYLFVRNCFDQYILDRCKQYGKLHASTDLCGVIFADVTFACDLRGHDFGVPR